jgi:hypothetical protein
VKGHGPGTDASVGGDLGEKFGEEEKTVAIVLLLRQIREKF